MSLDTVDVIKSDIARKCLLFARLVAVTAISIGILVLIGWVLDIDTLKSVLPDAATMKPNTAVCFILTGSTLWLLQRTPLRLQDQRHRLIGSSYLALIVFIAVVTLTEYLFTLDLGIDLLFFPQALLATQIEYPGRMAPITAMEFIILGASLLLLDSRSRAGQLFSQYLALAGTVLGLVAVLGYVYDVPSLYSFFPYSSMALHTSLLFTLLGMGLLLVRPDVGLIATVTGNRPGSVMARQILPLALVLPFVMGWLRLLGEQAGLYGTGFGLALFATSNVIIFAILVWWSARSLNAADKVRQSVDEQLRKSNENLETEMLERKRAEQALPEAHEQLQLRIRELARSNMDLQQFAYVASHDLQTPLRSISGFMQLLAENYRGKLDAQADEWIDKTITSTQRMQQLIRDLLEYSRVDSRARPFQPVSMAEVFEETVKLLEQSIREIHGEVTRGNLPTVLGDQSLL
ncbi:MAG TPA: histidine kinase dimerization/phospho-acceptor domain-containing protein, partial [Gammaproteobacteria bacterium]